MNEDDLKFVTECEQRAEQATVGPWKLWGMSVFADPKDTSNVDDGIRVADTFAMNKRGQPRTFDAGFIALARSAVPRLCAMVREQEKRARHAEQERDAVNARIAKGTNCEYSESGYCGACEVCCGNTDKRQSIRIAELEAEVAKLKPDAEHWRNRIVPSERYAKD